MLQGHQVRHAIMIDIGYQYLGSQIQTVIHNRFFHFFYPTRK